MTRLLLAVLLGIALTLAWQSYGDDAKRTVGPWLRDTVTMRAPSLSGLLPGWTEASSAVAEPPKQTQADAGTRQAQPESAARQTRPLPFRDITESELAKASTPAPEAAPPSLDTIARELATIRRSTEQLAAKQQQMSESLDTLRTEIAEKLSSAPSAAVTPPGESGPRPARRGR